MVAADGDALKAAVAKVKSPPPRTARSIQAEAPFLTFALRLEQHILASAKAAIAARGRFTLALSGGSMPQVRTSDGYPACLQSGVNPQPPPSCLIKPPTQLYIINIYRR